MAKDPFQPRQYSFSGTPQAIQAAVDSHSATMYAQAQNEASKNQRAAQEAQAVANLGGQLVNQPANLFGAYAPAAANAYGTLGGMYNTGMQTLGQMFDSYSDAYSAYGNAIGNIAGNASQAAANENAGRYAAYASGLDSYSNALGTLGSAALAGYGTAANAAMQAHAARETAAMKAMADMVAANQAAASQYGVGRDTALAGLGAAYGNAAGGLGLARANLGGAAATLGGQGAMSLGGLSTGIADATANASAAASQGQAALSAALADAASGISSSEANALAGAAASANDATAGINSSTANALAGLGGSSAALGASLGGNMTDASANSLNYTRDMAKLDLARTLGLASANVASQNFGGGPGGFSISGPSGVIAEGSYPGYGAGTSVPPAYLDPNASTPWYASPQVSDGGSTAMLRGVQDQGFGQLSSISDALTYGMDSSLQDVRNRSADTSAGIASAGQRGLGFLADESTTAGNRIGSAYDDAVQRISYEGDSGRQSILDSLASSADIINAQGAGIDSDAMAAMSGIDASRLGVEQSGILDSLTQNFQSGFDALNSAYAAGRQDPRVLLQDALTGTSGILSPLLTAATDGYYNWGNNFPQPLDPRFGGSGFIDPVPYLAALQAGWDPYRSELGNAFYNQNTNVLGALQSGRLDYFDTADQLLDAYRAPPVTELSLPSWNGSTAAARVGMPIA